VLMNLFLHAVTDHALWTQRLAHRHEIVVRVS
jgi:hypothetical protein